jgi:hypothetical protein
MPILMMHLRILFLLKAFSNKKSIIPLTNQKQKISNILQEYLVVNGVIASPFAANHMMANIYYNLHRFLYILCPSLLSSSLFHTINEDLGRLIPVFGPSSALLL